MERPPQTISVHVDNVAYCFDAVVKAQHGASLKIEDDPADAKGAKYVNNAAIEPRELTLDIMMSDVVTTVDPLAIAHDSRSVSAFAILEKWRSGRTFVSVKTRFALYSSMLVKSITVTEDDTNPEGLTASVVFREVLQKEVAKKAKTKSKKPPAANQGEATTTEYASTAYAHANPDKDVKNWTEAVS